MTDVVDRHIVMLAPEERHCVEFFVHSQHVARRSLALALGHHPMLDPDVVAGMRIRPTRDIAGGVDAASTRLEIGVDQYAAVHHKAGLLGQRETRPHTHTDDHEIGIEGLTVSNATRRP